MKRITRDLIRFNNGEIHRRTIFKENDVFVVKWMGGLVEVKQNARGVWYSI